MPRGHSATSPLRATARERERQAFALRKAGATYDEIARQLGVSRQAAHKSVRRVLLRLIADRNVDATDVLDLELARLDELLKAVWKRAREGDDAAIDRALKISHRRAQLLGLDKRDSGSSATTGGAVASVTFSLSDIAPADAPQDEPEP